MKKNTVLVTLDHSKQSLEAAAYISAMLNPMEFSVTLFHVDSHLFDIFFDCDDKPPSELTGQSSFAHWINVQRHSIDGNLEKSRQLFIDKGFPEKHIRMVKHPLGKGVTRDILDESRKGYALLVAGKSGSNRLSGELTGTVTTKLLTRTFHIPLVIASGIPETRNILVGYDGSQGADTAVQKAAFLLRKDVDLVKIMHVIRSFNQVMSLAGHDDTTIYESYVPELETALFRIRKEKMEPLLVKAADEFINRGFPSSRIHWAMIDQSASRSNTLLSTAREGYGTIVLGRRGHSNVEDFFMGRVGKKVVEQADSSAVWII